MKYPYIVNKDGVYYPAGTEVPEDTTTKMELTDNVLEGALDTAEDDGVAVDAETVTEQQEVSDGQLAEDVEKPRKGGKKA